jgi:hypothetical protein
VAKWGGEGERRKKGRRGNREIRRGMRRGRKRRGEGQIEAT